ncbi:hypothetical protein U9M48_001851 [Paspalum notatum var. saurae]|uniref:Uncharacterized protein n=1 Tax=Paspalum notatum var. saurae TaxID=547442 RepID=A0AAQ3SH09_PASNO
MGAPARPSNRLASAALAPPCTASHPAWLKARAWPPDLPPWSGLAHRPRPRAGRPPELASKVAASPRELLREHIALLTLDALDPDPPPAALLPEKIQMLMFSSEPAPPLPTPACAATCGGAMVARREAADSYSLPRNGISRLLIYDKFKELLTKLAGLGSRKIQICN